MTQATLTHIALHVRDLEACLAFYRDYCGLQKVHEREDESGCRVAWIARPGDEGCFVFVLIEGGDEQRPASGALDHLGFACDSRAEVERLAARARDEGRLLWPLCDAPQPLGYFCGVRDPNGNQVEFSYGQPLGPDPGPPTDRESAS